MPNVVEICAGAGGQSLGLEKAGFGHACAVEKDPNACNTLRHNRPSWEVREGDVLDKTVFDPLDFTGIDLLAGGVPCPPFSIAGQQLGAQDERDLYRFAIGLVPIIRPKALLLENVKGLAQRRFDGYRSHVNAVLEKAGYFVSWKLIRSSDHGVSQLRPRLLLVALQPEYAEYFAWPDPSPQSAPSVGSVLGDLMGERGWSGAAGWSAAANDIAPTIVGGSHRHGGADLGPTRTKAAWLSLGVDAHGVADQSPGPDAVVSHRPRLTNGMVARLQGWTSDDKWEITGAKTATYRQIGNAFPPPVARAVGSAIGAALNQTGKKRPLSNFEDASQSSVYSALTQEAGQFISLVQLVHRTGQPADRISEALENLRKDFKISRQGSRAYPKFRFDPCQNQQVFSMKPSH